jgi:hypothetical protein
MPACGNSICIGDCKAGFADCNMNKLSDGCEINTQTDMANCGGCGTVCNNKCNAANTQIAQVGCNMGACVAAKCNAGYFDVDKDCTNGCECQESLGGAAACMGAQAIAVTLGSKNLTKSGTLIMATDAWYAFTFPGSTTSLNFHPSVALTTNPGNAFTLEVYYDCAGHNATCGTNANPPAPGADKPVGITGAWETFYDVKGIMPAADVTNYGDMLHPTIPYGGGNTDVLPDTVYVRVLRGNVNSQKCSDYQYTITYGNTN